MRARPQSQTVVANPWPFPGDWAVGAALIVGLRSRVPPHSLQVGAMNDPMIR